MTAAELFDSIDDNEIQSLVEILENNGWIETKEHPFTNGKSYDDIEMEKACNKISTGRLRLSNEDEAIIIAISNKL